MKDVIRFKQGGRQELIHRNITREQAEEWCSSELTHKAGKWFDGFADTGTRCAKQKPKFYRYHTPTPTSI